MCWVILCIKIVQNRLYQHSVVDLRGYKYCYFPGELPRLSQDEIYPYLSSECIPDLPVK